MSGGGYFGFTAGGTQYNASAGYGATSGYAGVTYAAPSAYGYTAPAAAAGNPTAAYASAYQGAAGTQQPAANTNSFSGGSYAQRIDGNTFVAASSPATAATQPRNSSGVNQSFKAPAPRSGGGGGNRGGGGGGGSYTGYDAAVYAAATSYLQSKATGGGQQWLGLKKSGGASGTPMGGGGGGGAPSMRGGFPNKSRGGSFRSPGTQQLHYCDVCKISCAGPQTYREHLEGQKHKKKEAQEKSGTAQPLAKSKASFRCDLCGVTCTGSDTYQAHVRGSKHQKTLKLHQTLGKPIPSSEPVVIPPGGSDSGKKIVGVSKIGFVSGAKLATTATGTREVPIGPSADDAAMVDALAAEANLQPVGEDYVEPVKDHTGKVVQFFCKLCDCKFNDLNAKDMHLKGRRHRLQFKKKVNPELEVDLKPVMTGRNRRQGEEKLRRELMRLRQQELWSMRAMYQNQMMAPNQMGPPRPLMGGAGSGTRGGETMDDRHVLAKHAAIYPTDEELTAVQTIVGNMEKALKGVSDKFAEEDEKKKKKEEKPAEKKEDEVKKETADADEEPERLLKGVMRVGLLAKGILLRGDLRVNLVVLCSDKPTKTVLSRVSQLLPEQIKSISEDKYDIAMVPEKASLIVTSTAEPKSVVDIVFTSVTMRDGADGDATGKSDPPDLLAKQKCLEALADLRHAKWFQARCTNLQSCLVTLRIMRDICQRIPTWAPVSNWALELLVEKVITSAGVPLSPGDALRRVFEAVASGVLLPNGPGLLDPCEKEVVDAVTTLTPQQREDITSSAQHALRLIAFNQLYKILGIERLPDRIVPREARKRPRESTESAGEPAEAASNGKKDKKEPEVEPGEVPKVPKSS